MITAVEALLNNFWIRKEEDPELFYEVKKGLSSSRTFLTEHLRWNITETNEVIKLEKIPVAPMSWMGLPGFKEPLDYCLLCAMLMYLAGKPKNHQFTLVQATKLIEGYLSDVSPVDWKKRTHRKSFVRVLNFMEDYGLLYRNDGNFKRFEDECPVEDTYETLYTNTALSPYFPVNFSYDISHFDTLPDFEKAANNVYHGDASPDRAPVMRQLLLTPGFYWEGNKPDRQYTYLKNQRGRVESAIQAHLNGELEVYRNGAFFVLRADEDNGDSDSASPPMPYGGSRQNSRHNAAIMLSTMIQTGIREGRYLRNTDDRVVIRKSELYKLVCDCQKRYGGAWSKQFRLLSSSALENELTQFLMDWQIIDFQERDYIILPAIAKWSAQYPAGIQTQHIPTEDEVKERVNNDTMEPE